MKNKKVLILSIFLVSMLIILIISVSYAYFMTEVNTDNNVEVLTVTGDMTSFTTSKSDNLTVNSVGLMGQTNAGSYVEATSNMIVTVTPIDNSNTTVCYYDLVLEELGDHYTKSSGIEDRKELTIKTKLSDNLAISNPEIYGYSTVLYTKNQFIWQENQIDNFTFTDKIGTLSYNDSTYIAKLSNDTLISNNQSNSLLTSQIGKIRIIVPKGETSNFQTISVNVRLYNLDVNQDAILNKNYSYSLKVINPSCGTLDGTNNATTSVDTTIYSASDYITNLYNDVYDEEIYTDTHDSYVNYRFVGHNPDNFVIFNNEKWRIIGVFDFDSTGSSDKLVKIIINEGLENIAWDTNSKNNWVTSSLNNLLNGTYYDGTDTTYNALNDTSRSQIATVTWPVGAHNQFSDDTLGFYNAERGTVVYSTNPTTWNGNIGLFYPSDYGYSTSGNNKISRDNCLLYDLRNIRNYAACYKNAWILYNGANATNDGNVISQWTMTHSTLGTNYAFDIHGSTNNIYTSFSNYTYLVKPVVYLKSSVNICTGDGTYDNPYTLC